MKRIGIVYLIASFSVRQRPYKKAVRLTIYKIGKSQLGRRKKRLAEINNSTKGSVEKIIFFAPAPAFWLESLLRKIYQKWRYTYKGSGKTEYIWPKLHFPILLIVAVGLNSFLGVDLLGMLLSLMIAVLLPDLLVLAPVLIVMLLCWVFFLALLLGLPVGLFWVVFHVTM